MNDERVPAPDPEGPLASRSGEAIEEAAVRAPTPRRSQARELPGRRSTRTIRSAPGGTCTGPRRTAEDLGKLRGAHADLLNIALRLLRLLVRDGVEPTAGLRPRMSARDAEVVVAGGALLHDIGMSIIATTTRPTASSSPPAPSTGCSPAPTKSRTRRGRSSEILHAIIGHRRRGEPYTVEAGVVRVADALDMAQGRTRDPLEAGQRGHPLDLRGGNDEVRIEPGEGRAVESRSSSTTRPGSFRSMICWRRRRAEPR